MSTDILALSRRKKRKKFFWKTGLILLGIFVFLGGIIAFFNISKFRINDISIEGVNVLDEEQIREETANLLKGKFLKIIPYDNIFILPKSEIAAELIETFPVLKSIAIGRDFSRKISVLLEERKPEAIWCISPIATTTDLGDLALRSLGEGGCAFADENGFIFQPAPSFSGAIFPVFYDERQLLASSSGGPAAIGKEMMAESEFQELFSFNKILAKNNMDVAKIVLKDNKEHEVYLKEGWYIKLNDKNEPNLSFSNLQLVLDGTIKEKRPTLEYIDLRSGNKVFFKYK